MLKKCNWALITIIALAFGLRIIGINHSFPFIFHPDEPAVVRTALGMRFDLNPAHFDWPHFFIYLNYFLYMAFARIRTFLEAANLKNTLPGIIWNDDLIFYLLSRIFAATLGALTVIPAYLSGKKLFNKKVGLLAAFVFSILPFHVWHSHYSLIDVPMTFLLAWSFYFSIKIYFEKDLKNYIFAGIFLGLAAATKYNAALGAITIVLAHIYRILNSKEEGFISKSFKNLVVSGVSSALAFVIGMPYAVLDYKTFIRTDGPQGALWQFTNVGKVGFFTQVAQFFTGFLSKFPGNLSPTFFIIFVFSIIYLVFRGREDANNRKAIFLHILSVFYLFYVSGLEKTRAHYFMITYPSFSLVVGYFVLSFSEKIPVKKLKIIFLVLVFLSPLSLSVKNSLAFVEKDTRNVLYDWLKKDVQATETLVYDGNDLDMVFKSGLLENEIRRSRNNTAEDIFSLSGYLVVSVDDSEKVFINLAKVTIPEDPYLEISNKNSRGPFIEIYKLPIEHAD